MRIARCLATAATLVFATSARADEPAPKAARTAAHAPSSSESLAQALAEAWPDRPEWLDMYTDIVKGSQLGPNDGWFRRAVAQKRFDWKWAKKRYDANADDAITRQEFPGSDFDFARLDRDRDGKVTAEDFDFSSHALTPSPGAMLFMRLDRDGNGKVSREEYEAFFKRCDSGSQGFLSLGDLTETLPAPSPSRGGSSTRSGPSPETLIKGLFHQEIGSLQPGPALGDAVTDFTLKTTGGKQEVTLSKLIGPKPVVLVFGNFTCGPFRSQAGNVAKLHALYKDRAAFVMVYVREAHPTDGWSMESNDRVGVSLAQPTTYAERTSVASRCSKQLSLGFPMLVDTMDDAVGARYSGMPSRLYLIDPKGRVAYKSGRGPFGFKPAELEQSLVLLLQQDQKQEK